MECGTGFQDPPIVDSTTELVYDFIAYGCDGGNTPGHNTYINRFAAQRQPRLTPARATAPL